MADKSIVDGWLCSARPMVSPNFNQRPDGAVISLLVIHNISLPPGQYGGDHIEHFFTNQLDCTLDPFYKEIDGVEVSSHLLIKRTGEVIQFVPFAERAWHAGRSVFESCEECNDFSIGIELEGTDDDPYTEAQYQSLAIITRKLMIEYPDITKNRIVGHSDISPGRKTDPGESFDWNNYFMKSGLEIPALERSGQ